MRKLLVLALFLLITPYAVAETDGWRFPSDTVPYGDSLVVNYDVNYIECDPTVAGNCPGSSEGYVGSIAELHVEGCPGSSKMDSDGGDWTDEDHNVIRYRTDAEIPNLIQCALEKDKKIKIESRDKPNKGDIVGQGGSVTVTANNMDPHWGENLLLNYNLEDDQLRNFQLTNDEWDNFDTSGDLKVMVQEYDGAFDGSERQSYLRESGSVATLNDAVVDLTQGTSGGCSTDPCKVRDKNFERPNNWGYGDVEGEWGFSSQTPLHQQGDFVPEGQLINGYFPEHYDYDSRFDSTSESRNSGDGPYFFICREGAEMDSGYSTGQVPQVVDANDPSNSDTSDLYKCDTSTGEWKKTTECDDNLDNDGDQAIDLDDTSCNGDKTNNDEAADSACTPVIERTSNGIIRANWGGNKIDSTGACDGSNGDRERYSNSNVEGEENNPQEFTCDSAAISSDFCESGERTYNNHDEESSLRGDQITGVTYYPTHDYIVSMLDKGEHSLQLSGQQKEMMNRFVDENGWKAPKMAVDAGTYGVESTQLYRESGADAHGESWWFDTLGMVDGDGNGYTEYSYDDSWIPANAGSGNEHVGDAKFPGGFAGRCPPGMNWARESDQWRCTAGPPWDQAVMLPETTHEGDQGTIGFVVMPYTWKDATTETEKNLGLETWKEAWEDFYGGTAGSDQTLTEIRGACYPSDSFTLMFDDAITVQNDSAVRGTDYFRTNRNIDTSRDRPLPVYDEVAMHGNNTYTCHWKYSQNGDASTPIQAGTVVPLQNSGATYGDVNVTEAQDYFIDGEGDSNFDGYSPNLKTSYSAGQFKNCAEAMDSGETC